MARDLDAYVASEDNDRRRPNQRDSKPWGKRMLSIFSVLFLIGVVIAVALVIHKSNDSSDDTANKSAIRPDNNVAANKTETSSGSTNSSTNGSTNNNPTTNSNSKSCVARRPPPHKRTVVFWQSEVDGCEKVPKGVTHVVFGFALVDGASGRVDPTFQNTDSEIMGCVKALRANCIATLGSIGGSTNNDAIANITDPIAFAASAVALVEKFGFDGVDIDDETVGSAFNASRVVAFVQKTREALNKKDETLLLTYDSYFNEGEPSFCTNAAFAAYTRCFPTQLLASLDWVNIMAYNVAQDNATAATIYAQALSSTFVEWKTQLQGDFSKATIGVCVARSCAYGPGPSAEVIAQWNTFARTVGSGGGMMVYAASGETTENFAVTRSVLAA